MRTPVEGDWLRLHRATGQGYVIGPDEHGRPSRVYVGRYFAADGRTPCRATVERAARYLREGTVLGTVWAARARAFDPEALTVAGLAALFLRHAEGYYAGSKNEVAHYTMVLDEAKALYASVPASQFGPKALKAVRAGMEASDRFARMTLNSHIGRLVRVFKWAAGNELVPASVYAALRCVEGLRKGRTNCREPGKVRPVLDEHVHAVLPHVSRQVRAMIELQRLTGMRPGEVVILRPADLDRTTNPWTYTPSKHKTEHRGIARTVFLGPRAQQVVTPFLLRAESDFAFSAAEAERERLNARHAARVTPEGYGNTPGSNIVTRPEKAPGDRYTTASYRVAIARACADAQVPTWKPNQLRHAAATEFRRQFGIEAARVSLGHSDASMTTTYAEADLELARRVAVEVG